MRPITKLAAGKKANPILQAQRKPTINALLKKLRAGNLDQLSFVREALNVAISLAGTKVRVYTRDGEIVAGKETLIKLATPPQDILLYDLGNTKVWYVNSTSADFHNSITPDVIRTKLRMAVDELENGQHVEIHDSLAVSYLKHCTDIDIENAKIPLHGDTPGSSLTLDEMVFGCRTSPQFRYAIVVKDGEGSRVEFWKRHLPPGAR